MKSLLFLFAATAFSQVVTIDAGSATDQYFSLDQTASYKYTTAALSMQPGVYKDLRGAYPGKTIHYDIPVPNGSTCNVKIDLIEPRPAGTDPASTVAVGLRVFTVTANGITTQPIDIFASVGSLKAYPYALSLIPITDGFLHMDFAASSRLVPVVSAIERDCQPPPAVPSLTMTPRNDNCNQGTNRSWMWGSITVGGQSFMAFRIDGDPNMNCMVFGPGQAAVAGQ